MDVRLYRSIRQILSETPRLEQWPELQAVLERASARRPRDWRLPLLACEVVGGRVEEAVPVAAALACLQIGIILVDDMLDEDPRGEYRVLGSGAAANLALALQATATGVVAGSDLPRAVKLATIRSLNQMMATVACGQRLDAQNPMDEAGYWRVVQMKSAPFFGAAMRVGALAGGAPEETAAHLERLGYLYGEMVQIHDDLNDSLAQPASPDWLLGRSSLPILFAQTVTHPWQERFGRLRLAVSEPAALAEAQTILIRCGAISYCIDCLLARREKAQALLRDARLSRTDGIAELLARMVAPVQQLFAAFERAPPAIQPG